MPPILVLERERILAHRQADRRRDQPLVRNRGLARGEESVSARKRTRPRGGKGPGRAARRVGREAARAAGEVLLEDVDRRQPEIGVAIARRDLGAETEGRGVRARAADVGRTHPPPVPGRGIERDAHLDAGRVIRSPAPDDGAEGRIRGHLDHIALRLGGGIPRQGRLHRLAGGVVGR